MSLPGLEITRAGPQMTLQDAGRPGHLGEGLSRGGAMDTLALAEGAALLGAPLQGHTALEMAGIGGSFRAIGDVVVALTGAPMDARLDGAALRWNATHLIPNGAELAINAARSGSYGYLHLAGGIQAPHMLGAQSAHLGAGIGGTLDVGDVLIRASDAAATPGLALEVDDRFSGGTLRLLPGFQTRLFDKATLARFTSTVFRKDTRASRMGARLAHDGAPFSTGAQLNILSEIIVPGDIQLVGDGTPFALMVECQTTGGYPRIATVISADLPTLAQAPAGAELRFRFVDLDTALLARKAACNTIENMPEMVRPVVRDPSEMGDLLTYHLISGATAGDDEP